MTIVAAVKPFLPLVLTFLGPRAFSYCRGLVTAIRIRPPPRVLPKDTARALNVLFLSICLFLFWSVPTSTGAWDQNIFYATDSQLRVPLDVLFARLSLLRPGGVLSADDLNLKPLLSTQLSRQHYLRFGPSTLLNCSFCQPEDHSSLLLYHLPIHVLLPHVLHLVVLGLSTCEPLVGRDAASWRTSSIYAAVAIAALDIFVMTTFTPRLELDMQSPIGLFWVARVLRPLALCLFDIMAALLIYASATNRLALFESQIGNCSYLSIEKQEQILAQTNISLQTAQTKLRAFSIARNATVRETGLKSADDEYWAAVVAMEGSVQGEGVWQDEEVQAATARALGGGEFDLEYVEKESKNFVASLTRGLEGGE